MRRRRALDILTIAVTAALLTATIHLLVVAFQYVVRGSIVFTSPDATWMAPAAYVAIFLAAALPLVLASAAMPRLVPLYVACFLLMALGAVILLLPVPRISNWASVALGLGVASVVTRAFRERPERWLARFRRVSTVIALSLAAISTVSLAARWAVRSWGVRSLGGVAADAPNVLFLVWDTVRADNLSVYGYPRPTTPVLEQVAREGMVFEWAIAPSPWTLPSHATLFTGRRADDLSADWYVPLDDRYPTLAERFRDAGYLTAGFVANGHYTNYDTGLARGFLFWHDFEISVSQALQTTWLAQVRFVRRVWRSRSIADVVAAIRGRNLEVPRKKDFDRKRGADVTNDFLAWYDANRGRPFFAFLNYFDAHLPVHTHPGHTERFQSDRDDIDRYDGALSYLDAELGRLMEALRVAGALDRTLVVVTSDHGELYGEHGLYGHAHNMYREVLHVPLVLRFPRGVPAGQRVTRAVALQDLPATIEALAGLPQAGRLPGVSLLAVDVEPASAAAVSDVRQASGGEADPTTPLARGSMVSVFDDAWHYIRYGDGVEELFAYRQDRAEALNAASQYPDVVQRLARVARPSREAAGR